MIRDHARSQRGISIAAGILLCLDFATSFMVLDELSARSNIWYSIFSLAPRSLALAIGIFLLIGRKSTTFGCVLVSYVLYFSVIHHLICAMINETAHDMYILTNFSPLQLLGTLLSAAFYLLLALDCFLSRKDTLRKVRFLFLILPVLMTVCSLCIHVESWFSRPFSSYLLDGPYSPGRIISEIVLPVLPAYLYDLFCTFLIGLAFFLPGKRKADPAPPCC